MTEIQEVEAAQMVQPEQLQEVVELPVTGPQAQVETQAAG